MIKILNLGLNDGEKLGWSIGSEGKPFGALWCDFKARKKPLYISPSKEVSKLFEKKELDKLVALPTHISGIVGSVEEREGYDETCLIYLKYPTDTAELITVHRGKGVNIIDEYHGSSEICLAVTYPKGNDGYIKIFSNIDNDRSMIVSISNGVVSSKMSVPRFATLERPYVIFKDRLSRKTICVTKDVIGNMDKYDCCISSESFKIENLDKEIKSKWVKVIVEKSSVNEDVKRQIKELCKNKHCRFVLV